MLRKRLLTIFAALLAACVTFPVFAQELNLAGTVFEDANTNNIFDAGDKPLWGVVVSDGKAVTVTNEKGLYRIQTAVGSIVFVSVPGHHYAPGNRFYRILDKLPARPKKIDFPLLRNIDAEDDGKFKFVFVSDTHTAEYLRAKEGTQKAYRTIAGLNPAFVIHGGDIAFDLLGLSREALAREQYDLYKDEVAPIIKKPFYHTIGNHDVFGWMARRKSSSAPPQEGKDIYREYFGPTYYSFNYKHCHFLVFDSIGHTKSKSGKATYYGALSPEQLEWVQRDLAEIDPSRPIILVSHIPMINALASLFGVKSDVVVAPDGKRTPKHQARGFQKLLGEVLKGYNFRLALAGHYHTYEDIHWKDNEHDAHFVVGGSVCGGKWKGDHVLGYSSWAEGFTIVDVDGEKFEFSYTPYGWVGTEEEPKE